MNSEFNKPSQYLTEYSQPEWLRLRKEFEEDDIKILFELFEKLNDLASIDKKSDREKLIKPYQGKLQPDMYEVLKNKPDDLSNAYDIQWYYSSKFFENQDSLRSYFEERDIEKKRNDRRKFIGKIWLTTAGVLATGFGTFKWVNRLFSEKPKEPNTTENQHNEILDNKESGYFLADQSTLDWYNETKKDISWYKNSQIVYQDPNDDTSWYILTTSRKRISFKKGLWTRKVASSTHIEWLLKSYRLEIKSSELQWWTNNFIKIYVTWSKSEEKEIKNEEDFQEFLPDIINDFSSIRLAKKNKLKKELEDNIRSK